MVASSVKKYKVAAVGDTASLASFRALSIECFPASAPGEAEKILEKLSSGGEYAVIFITEEVSREASAFVEKATKLTLPAVVTVPGVGGTEGRSGALLRNMVKRAVGFDLLEDKDV